MAYLSRYTHRVAIANSRLVAFDGKAVAFNWKDYRIEGPGRYKTMTLPTHEFIRRFLMHVLPKGLHRIRHYGLFANGKHRTRPRVARPAATRHAASGGRIFQLRSTARPAKAMPVLRRPHDLHRDLRARLPAGAPLQRRCYSDQDRHLMMPLCPIKRCNDFRHSRRLLPGSASPRRRAPHSSAFPAAISSYDARSTPPLQRQAPRVRSKRSPRPAASIFRDTQSAAKSP